MQCPKCSHVQLFEGAECERCGVIFARMHAASERTAKASSSPALEEAASAQAVASPALDALPSPGLDASPAEAAPPAAVPISRDGWLAIAAGGGLAALMQLIPALEVMIGYFLVLVHELGHALAGWLFGYPSVPAFDFTYGGGVTAHQSQKKILVLLVFGLLAALFWAFRRNRPSQVLVGVLALAYGYALATPWHEIVMIAMGHGAELLFASLFLNRALSGRACTYEIERPLYAWIGFYIILHDLRFSYGLIAYPYERLAYMNAKGGGHWMDFSRLANDYFNTSLESIATAFLLLCLAPPLLSFLFHRYRPQLGALAMRLRRIE
jgi:hypothetical protein